MGKGKKKKSFFNKPGEKPEEEAQPQGSAPVEEARVFDTAQSESVLEQAEEVVYKQWKGLSNKDFKSWLKASPMYREVWNQMRGDNNRMHRASVGWPLNWVNWAFTNKYMRPISCGLLAGFGGLAVVAGVQNTVHRRRTVRSQKEAAEIEAAEGVYDLGDSDNVIDMREAM